METSTLRPAVPVALQARSPLLRLQSDDRLVAMIRRGNQAAFELLVSRYQTRLLAFCRHLLGSREDAEDVLQDVLAAAYRAMLADDRPINVKPWLYRIARNRCLNHMRRNTAIGVDSMDIHLADHGATTADRVHEREEFRQLVSDIEDLPETQRTALILREMDALSYEQIAEAMETTVSGVKSLLVRARVSLTEAAEARLLSCDQVREELAEVAEGLRRKAGSPARRHVKGCARCGVFQRELRRTDRALSALIVPAGPLAFFHKAILSHFIGHSAAAGSAASGLGAAGSGGGAAGAGAVGAGAGAGAAGAGAAGAGGFITAGVSAVATKTAAGLAAAALLTAGTVAVSHHSASPSQGPSGAALVNRAVTGGIAQVASANTGIAGSVAAAPMATIAANDEIARTRRRAPKSARPVSGQRLLQLQRSVAAETPSSPAPDATAAVDPGSPDAAPVASDPSADSGAVPPATGGVSAPGPSDSTAASVPATVAPVTVAPAPSEATVTTTPAAAAPTTASPAPTTASPAPTTATPTPTPSATTPAPAATGPAAGPGGDPTSGAVNPAPAGTSGEPPAATGTGSGAVPNGTGSGAGTDGPGT